MAGILASAAMAALYVHGGAAWPLGFVFLVPWLRTLDTSNTLAGALLRTYAMSLAYTAATFAWFGMAIGRYAQCGAGTGLLLLLLIAPLFQPQFFAFALVRRLALRRYGIVLGALAGAAAWVAAEWLLPKLLGDTLGHGLYPSRLLRQGADVGGAAGLTLMLLLANECVTAAWARIGAGWRAVAPALVLAALPPLLLAAYGLAVLSQEASTPGQTLRVGLIQSNLVGYESARREKGAQAVVREVLNTHFAMSYDAVVRQHADAVLWSETAYPTTFGHPKNAAGAEFDREIVDIVHAAGVPFVFGTYDQDNAGEYNAAAIVLPRTGLLGFYRKTRLFPLTEYVPAWLDSPALRRALPWTGNWVPGNGARVFPLRLADGREIPVLPLICRDDVDANLAIDGARLGAQVILTMSNDSWFTTEALGAQLHQNVAAFRSIETRLPQFRVTNNGYSAAIDATGSVLAGTGMGERSLVIAGMPARAPAPTLMVMWGDWIGRAATIFLAALAGWSAMLAWHRRFAVAPRPAGVAMGTPIKLAVLPPAVRLAAGLLRLLSRGSLLGIALAMLFDETLRTNTLLQLRVFTALFLVPEAASSFLLLLYSAQATISNGNLVLERRAQRIAIALRDVATFSAWRLPLPCHGISLQLVTGARLELALSRPRALAEALTAHGIKERKDWASGRVLLQASQAARRSLLDHTLVKFVLLPLGLAIPAFHLHQTIAFGSPFGEYYTFGLKAYLSAFALWWAAWTIGTVLSGALLRALIETGTLLTVLLRPAWAGDSRQWLERLGHAALFLGLPVWLLLTVNGA